jgi:ribosomal protein L11 methyltransferase
VRSTGGKSIWRLRVAVSPESEDAVSCLLETILGCPPSVYTDAQTGRTWVTVYLPRRGDWTEARRRQVITGLGHIASLGLPIPRRHVAAARVANEDWAESWKRHFKPLTIGRELLILPSWSRRRARRGQAVVVLDPGLSFGTGNHPTTRFCLEELVAAHNRHPGCALLDAGCGSGILAIAAAKLGYHPVVALDFDPAAIRVATMNAVQNGVYDRMQVRRADLTRMPLLPQRTFDLVCANLTADLLTAQAKKLARLVAVEGRLVLAGILVRQFCEVEKAFADEGFKLVRSHRQKEWQSGAFRRR